MATTGLTGCLSSRAGAPITSPIAKHGQLGIKNGQVVDRNGRPFSVAGPSLFWHNKGWAHNGGLEPGAYYNARVVAAARRLWRASIIRTAIGVERYGGYIDEPDYAWQKLTTVADSAIAEGMYCIVDWHTHHAEDHIDVAVEFFQRVARRYVGMPNIIYEIYNEPLPAAEWRSVIKPYAAEVIRAIRAVDGRNLIVVGTSTWSQDVDLASEDPILGDPSLAYTLHFYAGSHGEALRDKARVAISRGLPLMVTEWGAVAANGDGDADQVETRRWMSFLREHGLSHCVWSLHSKEEGASILKPHTAPDGSWGTEQLTATGQLTTGIIRNW
ncbi:MAG: glycoside hydrolase family 5 protein [Pseudomonadota bacterium]